MITMIVFLLIIFFVFPYTFFKLDRYSRRFKKEGDEELRKFAKRFTDILEREKKMRRIIKEANVSILSNKILLEYYREIVIEVEASTRRSWDKEFNRELDEKEEELENEILQRMSKR